MRLRAPSPADLTEGRFDDAGWALWLGMVLPEVRVEIDINLKTSGYRFRLNGLEYPPLRD